VQCLTCAHECVVFPGKYGHCRTRKNLDGTLYAGTYGLVSSFSTNPMEKKPFFHYWPGSNALTVGSFGCNFDCLWCQNADISHTFPRKTEFPRYISPEDLVQRAVKARIGAISFSFNEPTLFAEYALDALVCMVPAGIRGNFVTNGFMSPDVRDALITAGLAAACINVKGDARVVQKYCGANVERVWTNAVAFAQAGVHVELVTLVIPGLNDDPYIIEGIARRILSDLDPETPWHLTKYYPCWKAREIGCTRVTPVVDLERCRQQGIDAGLQYVYIGNVPGHMGENTYCPGCGALVIERNLYDITPYYVVNKNFAACPSCGQIIPIKLK